MNKDLTPYESNLEEQASPEATFSPEPVSGAEETEKRGGDSTWKAIFSDMFQVIIPALALALVVHLFLAQATVVYGQSMEPNLVQYQRLVVDKISYRFHPPQRDDIVVLDLPQMDEMLVKRVVGLPGETVSIDDGVLYIDGVAHPEAFPHDMVAYDMAPVVLPPLYYFVLGDNRGNSNDSRSFGPVHRDSIVGRVWLRYWPLDQATIF